MPAMSYPNDVGIEAVADTGCTSLVNRLSASNVNVLVWPRASVVAIGLPLPS